MSTGSTLPSCALAEPRGRGGVGVRGAAPMRELGDLVVDLGARGDRATAVYRALLDAVRSGRLEPGERLPPTRALATDLGVSRTTVATAYDRLVAEGFLTARVGAGTFVADAARPVRPPRRGDRPGAAAGLDARARTRPAARPPKPAHDFRVGIPDARLFPFDTWRRLVDRRAAGRRPRPRHLRRPGRPPAAARGDRPAAGAVARASPPGPTRCWSPTAPSRPSTW